MSQYDDRLAVFALASRDIPDDGAQALVARDVWPLIDSARRTETSVADVVASDGLWPPAVDVSLRDRARQRLTHVGAARDVLASYEQRGLWAVTPCDHSFPARLRERLLGGAPCLLYGTGDANLLDRDGIGIVGSRDVDDDGIRTAQEISDVAIDAGLSVVSGGARGADQAALDRAVDRGGNAISVLAHPLSQRASLRGLRAVIESGRLCLVSPFKPDAGFSVAGAMARNRIIYGLSRVTCVVASDLERGGTWAGAVEALNQRFGTVAVWIGSGTGGGNAALAARGAHPISSAPDALAFQAVGNRLEQLPLGA